MPIPDDQLRACLRASGDFLQKRRQPPEIRDEVDLKIDIEGQQLTILEVRPRWDDKSKIVEHAIAKMKWVGSKSVWRLFWMRADMKWHSYDPKADARSIEALFEEVDRDPHHCFFG